MPAKTASIPVDGINDLSKYWIVIKMTIRAPTKSHEYGHTYAHSENLNATP